MYVNIYEAESYDDEAQIKVVVSLTLDDLIRELKQGEILATDWLQSRGYDAEFRIVVQGRQTGVGKSGNILDMRDGGPPLIIIPNH